MTFLFWGLIVTMLVFAIAAVVVPLGNGKPLLSAPGILVAVAVPAATLALYAFLGSPDAVTAELSQARRAQFESYPASNSRSGKPAASVASLVDGLKYRLDRDPNDSGGWLLLARSYQHLGHHDEASFAYERAQSLGRADLELEKLLRGANQSLQEAFTHAGPALRGRVKLSPAAASSVNPDDTIFIFAKESPNHRMPIVALRKPAADLPIEFNLTDRHVMVPGTHLADFETLVVTARVSRSGLATDVIEGLEVWSKPVSPIDGAEIELIIGMDPQAGDLGDE